MRPAADGPGACARPPEEAPFVPRDGDVESGAQDDPSDDDDAAEVA